MYGPEMDFTPTTTHLHVVSNIRRKPLRTYKSPSMGEMSSPIILRASSASLKKQTPSTLPEASASLALSPQNHDPTHNPMKRKRYPMAPPLPLYHPLGPLAQSLPLLDPTTFGLPAQPPTDEDENKRASGRSRRPASKVRDSEEENTTSPTNGAVGDQPPDAPTPPAPTVPETREKTSPRKRRTGGGKRKRKEVDDGDATYPAKRTRAPRGAAKEQVMEEDSPTEAGMAEGGATPEPVVEEKRPERRSTRSSGIKRRDSSASETTSVAASVVNKAKDTDAMEIDRRSVSDETRPASVVRSEKEEGELSEEGQAMVS
ncbi:hypothetical protein BDN72DRAFT_510678 [Pluteus cervinus]|uniref:Uncharacterized protein n=1 Tax=Pluteus cervinus TaxID=181527 RepID=A0ACD3BCH3_9AGAR|nr:hypothetical protein BDN72DRAFT_510678 [Pluteus cervinus]